MAAAVTGTRLTLARIGIAGGLSLAAQVTVGAVVYLAVARVVARETWRQIMRLVFSDRLQKPVLFEQVGGGADRGERQL
jgi:hypothetical protein